MDLVTRTFITLGGDPTTLDLTRYQRHGSERGIKKMKSRAKWIVSILALIASAVPVLHLGAVFLELIYLLRQMAHVAWSVGILKGASVHQADLVHILAIWSGGATINDLNMNEVVSAKMSVKGGGKILAKVPGKLTGKIASKLVLKIAAKTGGKLLTGFLSILGGGISAWISVYFLNTIAAAADEYYTALRIVESEMH